MQYLIYVGRIKLKRLNIIIIKFLNFILIKSLNIKPGKKFR
jgi:hypothetical protein